MEAHVDFYGVCNWYPEHGDYLVYEKDREAFMDLAPAGKVFHCVGRDGPWLLLKYGENFYRASAEMLEKVRAPAFEVGQRVMAKGKCGVIVCMMWHFKNVAPVYLLAFDGKKSSRRYVETELTAVD